MFKFWRQRELHAKAVAIWECAPQTSGLRDQSPVRDTKKQVRVIMLNNSNLYRISYNKVDEQGLYLYLYNYSMYLYLYNYSG